MARKYESLIYKKDRGLLEKSHHQASCWYMKSSRENIISEITTISFVSFYKYIRFYIMFPVFINLTQTILIPS